MSTQTQLIEDLGWDFARTSMRDELLGEVLADARTVGAPGWDPPLPFDEFELPPFPVESLTGWLRAFIAALAVATQTPVDLGALLALAAAAVACARRVIVQVRPGYVEPVNLYTVTALPPASRKSAVFADVKSPIERFERDTTRQDVPQIAEERARARIREKTLEELQKQAAKAQAGERDALVEQARELAREIAGNPEQTPLRLLADDVTPERLAALLAEHGGRLGVFSPEGGPFEIMAGRYSGGKGAPNFGIYLKGHAGDTLRVDRVGRPPQFVDRPALTLGLAVQPDVVRSLASIPGSRGRGLLGRFLYAMPRSTVGRRDVDPPPVPRDVREDYHARMRALLELMPGTDAEGEPAEHALTLSEGAYEAYLAFSRWVEPQLTDFGQMAEMADWAGKLPGAVVRIAGLLHVADHAGEPAPWVTPIPAETMGRAVAVGRFLIPHARAAFALMGCDPLVEDARYVLRWVERNGSPEFSKRDAFEGTKSRFKKVTALEPALGLLADHNFIRQRAHVARAGRGQPPSPTFEVNPSVFGADRRAVSGPTPPPAPACPAEAPTGPLPAPEECGGDFEEGVV